MTKSSSFLRKFVVLLMAFALVVTYSVVPMNQAFAASKKPTKITLTTTSKTVDIKGKVTVSVKSVKPAKASKAVKWKSSNKKIATVNSKGVVTGKKKGKVTITAISKANKKVKKTIKITVKDIKPKSAKLNATSKTLTVGQSFTLKGTVAPAGVYAPTAWTTSDKSVATVSGGKVTAVKAGTATITFATTKASGKVVKATCKVTVQKPIKETDPVIGEAKERTVYNSFDMTKYDAGKVVEVWVPVPQNDKFQTVTDVKFAADGMAEAKITTEKVNGNKMLYLKWDKDADPAKRTAVLSYHVKRVEVSRTDLTEDPAAGLPADAKAALTKESDFVKVNDPVVKEAAQKIVEGKTGTVEKARAIYDWVIANLERIDNGEELENADGTKKTFEVIGCGYGDTVKILTDLKEFGRAGGHCTDINSTFVALCRAAGVPAREMFGIRMNDGLNDAGFGKISDHQHCWAEFYVPGTGWVYADPGDVLKAVKGSNKNMSIADVEAAKKTADVEKFWAKVDNNRFVLARGRDVDLEPKQTSGHANTFGYPRADIDGEYVECTKYKDFVYDLECFEDAPITVDKENKTVSLKATVNDTIHMNAFDDQTHHVVVNKFGSNAKIALLNTLAKPGDVYAALSEIAKPADDFNKAQAIVDGTNQNVFLKNGSELEVTFSWEEGGQTKTAGMSDFFYHISEKGGDNSKIEPYTTVMRFGGCKENVDQWADSTVKGIKSGNQTGCITCTFSCWIGTVSNSAYAYSTAESLVNRENVPAPGTEVTVTYKLVEPKTITADELKASLGTDDYKILDLRKADAYGTGHIPGAISADISAATAATATPDVVAAAKQTIVDAIEGDPEGTKYALICYTGNMYANQGRQFLRELGVANDNILILAQDNGTQGKQGGMAGWNAKYANYITSVMTSGQGVVSNGIKADDLAGVLAKDKDTFVVMDVRAKSDYDNGHIDGAVLATCPGSGPTDDARAAVKAVVDANGTDALYVACCYSGQKCADTADAILKDLGVPESNIIRLIGGMNGWSGPVVKTVEEFGDVVADRENKTVTLTATVNPVYTDNPTAVDHLVLNTAMKGSKDSPFLTDAKPLDLYDALIAIGAKPWSESNLTFADGLTLNDVPGDNADFSHLDVTINGTPIAQCFKYKKNGVETDSAEAFDMAFSGNRANQAAWNTGCVSCAFSCYAGVVSNAAIGIATASEAENYMYLDTDVLAGGQEVTIVYTLK